MPVGSANISSLVVENRVWLCKVNHLVPEYIK